MARLRPHQNETVLTYVDDAAVFTDPARATLTCKGARGGEVMTPVQ